MDNVTVTAARNYDHYRIGVVSVYGDDWYFCLTEDRRLLYGNAESMGLSADVEAGIYDAIKMDMAEEDYLNPRSRY